MALPLLLDTDIGTDIDDAYALVLAARNPEIDLRAVTTVNNDVVLRARIAKKLLRLMGRNNVPVAAGNAASLTRGETRGWLGHEGIGIDIADVHVPDLDPRPAEQVIAMACRSAAAHGAPLTIVTIGAMTNLALAIEQYPQDLALTERIIAMASDFCGFGPENARGEHNVACDPVAMHVVIESRLPLTLIGLNVTQQTTMTSEEVDAIDALGGPLAEALVGLHRAWFRQIKRQESPMHDGLAVAHVIRPELVELTPVHARMWHEPRSEGAVLYNACDEGEVTPWSIATSVDVAAFHAFLREWVHDAVIASAQQAQT